MSFGLEKDGESLLLSRALGLFDHPGAGASWLLNTTLFRCCVTVQMQLGVGRRRGNEATRDKPSSPGAHLAAGLLGNSLPGSILSPEDWFIPMASITSLCWQLLAPHLHLHLDVSWEPLSQHASTEFTVFCKSHPGSVKGTTIFWSLSNTWDTSDFLTPSPRSVLRSPRPVTSTSSENLSLLLRPHHQSSLPSLPA